MDSRYLQLLVAISVVLVLAQLRASASDGGVQYDHFATTECLQKPPSPSYGGGIIVNPDINNGVQGWTPFGNTTLEVRSAGDGNNYLVAQGRKNSYDAPSQNLNLTQGMMYTLAAWLQISGINTKGAVVKATVATNYSNGGAGTDDNCAGTVIARAGCWSLLKGGLTLDSSPSSATLYFESNDTETEIWLDSVSLQPFSPEQWKAHQEANIQQYRASIERSQTIHQANQEGHSHKMRYSEHNTEQ